MLNHENWRLIFGPPGTGKTTELRRIIRELAQNYGDAIIATSCTTTAALNIIAPRYGEAPLPIPKRNANTMHALCFAVLKLTKKQMTASHLKEFTALYPEYMTSDSFRRGLSLEEPMEAEAAASIGDEVFARYNLHRNQMKPRDEWDSALMRFTEKYEKWKKEAELFDFADLIERCLLDKWHHIPYGCKALIGDEFQDFTPIQLALFAKWAQDTEITVAAGDDDQTLYSYTGANPGALLGQGIPQRNIFVLPDSRRVPAKIQAVANAWIKGVSARQEKTYNAREAEGAVKFCNGTYTKPDFVAAQAYQYAMEGKTCMILAACSYMLAPTVHKLKEFGVPFHNPYRPSRGDWNPLDTRGYSMARRMALVLSYDDHEWTWRDLDAIVSVMQAEGVTERGAKKEIDGRADQDGASVVPVSELVALLTPQAFAELITGNIDFFTAHLLPDEIEKTRYPARILRSFGPRGLTATPPVVIGTIHSVKGAESQVVFLYTDLSQKAARSQANGIDGGDAVRRQFYVGLTRASETLVLCAPASRNFAKIPAYEAFDRAQRKEIAA